MFMTISGAVAQTFTDVKNAFNALGGNTAVKTISGAVAQTFTDVKNAFNGLGNSTIVKTISGAVAQTFTDVKNAFNALGGNTAVKTISGTVAQAFTDVKNAFSAISDKTATAKVQATKDSGSDSAAWNLATGTAAISRAVNIKGQKDYNSDSAAWKLATDTGNIARTANIKGQKDYNSDSAAWKLATESTTISRTAELKISADQNTTSSKSAWELLNSTDRNPIKKTFQVGISFLNTALTSVKNWLGLKAEGGVFSGGSWKSIPQFASGGVIRARNAIQRYAGGTLRAGSMFVAGEAGPEIVGHINGRTEVLNKSQIASAIYSAVLAGMETAVNSLGQYIARHMTTCTNAVITAVTAAQEPSNVTLSKSDTALLQRLTVLSGSIPYTVPAYAAGTVMPYEIVAEIRRQTHELKEAIYDSGEQVIQAIVSAISSHGIALADAIGKIQTATQQGYSPEWIVQRTIDEINLRTEMTGRSPLYG